VTNWHPESRVTSATEPGDTGGTQYKKPSKEPSKEPPYPPQAVGRGGGDNRVLEGKGPERPAKPSPAEWQQAFEELVASWPAANRGAGDRAVRRFRRLTPDEQRAAVDGARTYLAGQQRLGRAKLCDVSTYIGDRRWKPLTAPQAQPRIRWARRAPGARASPDRARGRRGLGWTTGARTLTRTRRSPSSNSSTDTRSQP
jgi:hypothetical protein